VAEEWLQWRRGPQGKPFRFLDYKNGVGKAASGEKPDETDERIEKPLRSPDLIAVNTLGQFAEHPRVAALREFVTDWYVSYLSIDQTRSQPEAGPQERLSKTGDNLPNVIQFFKEQHPDSLESIFNVLRNRIPRLESVLAEPMPDGRLLLQIKDAPFDRPVLSRFASDGTLKLLAYLTVLRAPEPAQFVGIEEPENYLHPRLLPELAEECQAATAHTQLLVTTHSPFFVNALKAEQVRILYRDDRGHCRAVRSADIKGIREFMEAGASLGYLWMEGRLGVGDPLVAAGEPRNEERHR
jgi:predicted ATPase